MWCARSHKKIYRGPTTASPTRAIRPPFCLAASIGSTASAGWSIHRTAITASTASSSIELPRRETTMQTVRTLIAESRGVAGLAVRAALVAGCALLVCACNTDQQVAGVPDAPADYRMRHPITISETDRSFEIFVGSNRGTLDPSQRAEVLAFAQTWRHESTGGVLVDLPVGTSNERAGAEAMHRVRSLLIATGVPSDGIVERGYHPPPRKLATIHIMYPRIAAQAGPCGV